MNDETSKPTVRERQRAWINQIREATGHAYARIARESGLAPSTLVRFMNDEESVHSLSATTEGKILNKYGARPEQAHALERITNFIRVPVVGVVQAGLWQAHFMPDEYVPEDYVMAPVDPRYPEIQRVAFKVMGDSMDLLYPQGTIVLAVRFYDLARPPKTGEKVIVVRQTDGVEEATVKEIELLADGRVALWPRSSNPEHSMALIVPEMHSLLAFPDDGAHPEVRIEALVVQSIRLE